MSMRNEEIHIAPKKKLFKELLLISIGKRDRFSTDLTAEDLAFLYEEAKKQALLGFLFTGIERAIVSSKSDWELKKVIFQWFAYCQALRTQNFVQGQRVEELTKLFNSSNIRNTLLKGQGYALLYPYPERRQCGDIDFWIEADRDKAIQFCKNKWGVHHINYKHLSLTNHPDSDVEIHFIPSWFYNPFIDCKFKKWYRKSLDDQFQLPMTTIFPTPTIDFNLVYCCVHIYRHIFDEGIGLRQLTDYYYILHASSAEQRKQAYGILCSFKMKRFVGAVMYVLKYFFEIDDDMLLCKTNKIQGEKLLHGILRGGNFGHHNPQNKHGNENIIFRAIRIIRHNSAIFVDYPSEVFWSPLWKIWHWCWRKKNGYL